MLVRIVPSPRACPDDIRMPDTMLLQRSICACISAMSPRQFAIAA